VSSPPFRTHKWRQLCIPNLTDASQSFVSLLRYPVGAATRLTAHWRMSACLARLSHAHLHARQHHCPRNPHRPTGSYGWQSVCSPSLITVHGRRRYQLSRLLFLLRPARRQDGRFGSPDRLQFGAPPGSAQLQIPQIGRLLHDVLAGEVVAALLEHLNQRRRPKKVVALAIATPRLVERQVWVMKRLAERISRAAGLHA
jgi:hypothetical protein